MPIKPIELPPGDFLRAHLRYDPKTGLLYRRSSGKLASLGGQPYARVSLKHKYYSAHRVIWRMEIAEEVPSEIDHINLDKHDNRLENFRAASRSENMRNFPRSKRNTSGFKGVCWREREGKWRASIKVNKKAFHLGNFDDPAEAHAAYVEAAARLHGEFANAGRAALSQQAPE